jgi:hypothetical protein
MVFSMNSRARVWILSVAIGVVDGLLFRIGFGTSAKLAAGKSGFYITAVMTIAFLTVVPFVMGYLAVSVYARELARKDKDIGWLHCLGLPTLSILLTLFITILFKIEGAICLIFAAPLALICGITGGITGGIVEHRKKNTKPAMLCVALAPLLVLAVELHIPQRFETRTVETGILILAPAQTIWNNIKSVDTIQPNELPPSWARRIGFPRPIAATLSHEGVGGVRHASFAGGLVFTETIDHWDDLHDLSFSIKANTDAIPPTTLDQHVTAGGPYFDVLEGEYTLEPLANGTILLHLRSRERISTHFNAYAGFWTDAVMRDIQNSILQVIKQRCERSAPVTGLR